MGLLLLFAFQTTEALGSPAGLLPPNPYVDTDRDGVPDATDVDDDNDGIIDSREDPDTDGDGNPETNALDTDGDGIPDYLDLDSDNDGILDNLEAQSTAGFIAPSGVDSDGNGLDDAYEASPGSCEGLQPVDKDGDKVPDFLDIDSDNDGILDNVEAQLTSGYIPPSGQDQNENGLDDAYESFGNEECDYNSKATRYQGADRVVLCHRENKNPGGKVRYHQISVAPSAVQAHLDHGDTLGECNKDVTPFVGGLDPVNTDGDCEPDFRDIDSDNDGILDNREAQQCNDFVASCTNDSDGNGLDDHYESHPGAGEGLTPVNSDTDSYPDYLDIDSDDDGIPDNVEAQPTDGYVPPSGTDTDGDGLDDGYEGSNLNDPTDVNDEIDDPANDLPDTDGTEDVNYRDVDDDGDGIDTPDEDADGDGDPTNDDTDGDGTPDYLDPTDDQPEEGRIEVNQLVTPNGDGRNDFLFIRNVDLAPNNTLKIFNRWGVAVYEGTNYNNQNNVFDGRSRGRSTVNTEAYLPAGIYYYIFEYELNQERITDNGYLYISK